MFKLYRSVLKPNNLSTLQKCYCSSSGSNLPQKPDVPQKPDKVPTEVNPLNNAVSKEIAKLQLPTREDMQWRTPWHEKEGQYYSFLKTFYSEHNQAYVLKFLQQDIDFSPSSIKRWWAKKKEKEAIILQSYIPERNQMLGNELAAAHFIVYREGQVKFFGDEKWIKANEFKEYDLPKHYQENMYLQAIDCTDMNLYYEGLANLRGLRQLEWLSLNGCEKLDDWALDCVSNIFSHSLVYLDLRNMPSITYRGLGALYKMEKLKILYVDDNFYNKEFEMTCLMLQEIKPDLDVRTDDFSL